LASAITKDDTIAKALKEAYNAEAKALKKEVDDISNDVSRILQDIKRDM
jgi:ABC-type Zn uptake system ZnuABC Zn-binding protein ZnuA